MKTEFLKELGLEQDVIDKVMAENGKDIEAAKGDVQKIEAERDSLKEQLATAQESLKAFEGVEPDKLKEEIKSLTDKLADQDKEYAAKLADMEFNSLLEKAITESGARNSKAVRALLDADALKASKNQTEDIKTAIEAVKKDNDYMFGSAEPIKNPTGPTGGGGGTDSKTALLRAAAGLPPEDKK